MLNLNIILNYFQEGTQYERIDFEICMPILTNNFTTGEHVLYKKPPTVKGVKCVLELR